MKIYDAKGAIVGRMAAKVAKDIINGEEVQVINAAEMLYSGKPAYTKELLKIRRGLTDKKDPQKAMKYPRVPYLLFKKVVSDMLPKKSQRGRDALKRLKAHNGVPEGIDASKAEVHNSAVKTGLPKKITLGKLCAEFGYKN